VLQGGSDDQHSVTHVNCAHPDRGPAARPHRSGLRCVPLLRIGFTVLPIVFGLDKFTNVLTTWDAYLAPWIVDISPLSAHHTMLVVGVIEIVAGIAVAIKPRYAAYIVAAWLAVRDFGLLVAALTLGRLASVYDPPGVGTPRSAGSFRAPIRPPVAATRFDGWTAESCRLLKGNATLIEQQLALARAGADVPIPRRTPAGSA
jgi:hypothetical protein